MTLLPWLIGYFMVGVVFSIATVVIFPPHGDYRPPGSLQLLAMATYAALWPALLLMACLYGTIRLRERRLDRQAAVGGSTLLASRSSAERASASEASTADARSEINQRETRRTIAGSPSRTVRVLYRSLSDD